MLIPILLFSSTFFLIHSEASAYNDKSVYLGVGYFSENSLGKQTQSNTGASTQQGTITYPLLVKYDYRIGFESFFSPALTYTLFNRKDAADSAEVGVLHLMFPFGQNFGSSQWDWSAGLGLLSRTIKGAGGLTQLNNGGSTSTFALPGRSVTQRTFTLNGGISYNPGASRFALDLMTEGILTTKRTYHLMFSYAYGFGGGYR